MLRLLFVIVLAGLAAAQSPSHPYLVLTHLPTANPTAQILSVDPAAAAATPLGRFVGDTLPPLTIALDPFDLDLVVALDLAPGSRIVRLERTGAALVAHHLFDLPGKVTALRISDDFLLAASDGGLGLWRAPRRGGVPQLAFAQANLTAMHGYGANGDAIVIAWTGRPGTAAVDSGVALVDARDGTPWLGPHTFPNPTGLELTGAVDLPTGVPRQLLSFADGSFALFAGVIGPPTPVVTSVVIPPGGAVAMIPEGLGGGLPLALGGAAFPRLYTVDWWTGAVTFVGPMLPGDPVGVCSGGSAMAQSLAMGEPCGSVVLNAGWTGLASPGATFSSDVLGPANGGVFLAMGRDDFPSLPVMLPGGCALDVAPDAVTFHVLSAIGVGSQAIAVPAGPAFVGTILFAQWLHLDPSAVAISTSSAVAFQIGL